MRHRWRKKYWANYLDGVERNEIFPQSTHNKHIDNKSHRETFYIEDNDYKILKNACIQNKHTLAGWIHSGLVPKEGVFKDSIEIKSKTQRGESLEECLSKN
ncbi:hypothetical protein LSPCS325_40710 [Lysinibacillus sp. CTST325]